MTNVNGYKFAFWALLATIAAFQIIINAVAHAHHEQSHSLLQLSGRPHHPAVYKKPSANARVAHSHADSKSESSALHDAARGKVWQEVLSTSPKIILLHNFATKEE